MVVLVLNAGDRKAWTATPWLTEECALKIATGRVIAGNVVLEGEPLKEGSTVTVISTEDGEAFDVCLRRSARFRRPLPRQIAAKWSLGRFAAEAARRYVAPPMRIEITRTAEAQIAQAAAWWKENRLSAPGAVLDELDRVLGLLALQPELGAKARPPGLSGVRRVCVN